MKADTVKHTQQINWLLQGDVSIQFQTHRDLLHKVRQDLQRRIAHEGWGAQFLSARNADGSWGRGFYQPKWTCSHYTLLDLKSLQIHPDNTLIRRSIESIADHEKGEDGGINPSATIQHSDVCINGSFLNYACFFGLDAPRIRSVVDFVLAQTMPDGGFNCCSNRSGATHSSVHSTLSVLEGILEYAKAGHSYRLAEMKAAEASAQEFLLRHGLFRSEGSGAVIHQDFLRLHFPVRWKYDILRALDYFRDAGFPWDPRLGPALQVLKEKERPQGYWTLAARHPGQVHFDMEHPGAASRWNTLRALRVLQWAQP